jgi:Uncharacterized protein conserved in bacteria (DUF2252)
VSQTTSKPMSQKTIVESTKAYEKWLRDQLGKNLVEPDLRTKHLRMAESAFPFLRATYWRWAETILDICPEFKGAPPVLGVGDLHLENFGTWRDDDGRLVWGVNDFDEAAEMPYPLDLVRVVASALLGCPHVGTARTISAAILRGYQRGLANPQPITLDHDYAWLRRLVVVPDLERTHFWLKMDSLKPSKKSPPPGYIKVLAGAMPDPKLKMQLHPRTAGLGSLGRPRWVGKAIWQGAPVVREVKAALPSAWALANGGNSRELHCYKIATGRYRAPDPWFALNGNTVVRRLSPNNRKLDTESHPLDLISRKYLRAIGREVAAIHLGDGNRGPAIQRDLERRDANWLASAATRATEFVRREQKEWRRSQR